MDEQTNREEGGYRATLDEAAERLVIRPEERDVSLSWEFSRAAAVRFIGLFGIVPKELRVA